HKGVDLNKTKSFLLVLVQRQFQFLLKILCHIFPLTCSFFCIILDNQEYHRCNWYKDFSNRNDRLQQNTEGNRSNNFQTFPVSQMKDRCANVDRNNPFYRVLSNK